MDFNHFTPILTFPRKGGRDLFAYLEIGQSSFLCGAGTCPLPLYGGELEWGYDFYGISLDYS